jgi:hypothetical protein
MFISLLDYKLYEEKTSLPLFLSPVASTQKEIDEYLLKKTLSLFHIYFYLLSIP